MPHSTLETSHRTSLLVVLYGNRDHEEIRRAVRQVQQGVARLPVDCTILVTGDRDGDLASVTVEAPHPPMRFVPSSRPGAYAGAIQAALAEPATSFIALSNGAVDLGALAYLVPLAQRYPIVWGYRLERRDSLLSRVLSAGYSGLARLFLGTGVRDVDGGAFLSIFQRPTLAEVAPDSRGFFAGAEVVARAAQRDIPVAEAAVSSTSFPLASGPGGWRGVLAVLRASARYWWSQVQFCGKPPEAQRRASWLFGLVLALLSALLLFTRLDQPLLDPDEGRQAEIPREMLAHDDLLLPRFQAAPYFEKPPLQYWLTTGTYTLFGMHPRSARLVPATAAWLAVLLTFCWARPVMGARRAFLGGLVLCLSIGFVTLGRIVLLDSLLACCVLAAWFTAHVAVSGPTLRWRWWLLSALVCGLGILVKGPVALVLLSAPVWIYQFVASSAVRPRWRAWSAYVTLALAVAVPWYVAMALRAPGYLTHFLWRDNVLRFVTPFDHQKPIWFYVPVLFGATFPWSLLWPALAYFLASRNPRVAVLRTPALGFCLLTFSWCVLFYSLSGCKSPPYLAPAFAPLALLIGFCLDAVLFWKLGVRDHYLGHVRQTLPRWATLCVLVTALFCYLATAVLGWQDPHVAMVKTVVTLTATVLWWRYGARLRPTLAWGACALATMALLSVAGRDLTLGWASRHTPATVARWVQRCRKKDGCPVVSYGKDWPSACFYLRRDAVRSFDEPFLPFLVDYLKQEPKVVVLVQRGQLLDKLLGALPPTLETRVHLPKREGQIAVVLVQHDSRLSLAK